MMRMLSFQGKHVINKYLKVKMKLKSRNQEVKSKDMIRNIVKCLLLYCIAFHEDMLEMSRNSLTTLKAKTLASL